MRSVAAAVVAVLSAVLLSGCGSGPTQVGAAAIVGDTEISMDYIQSWLARVLSDGKFKEELRASQKFDDLGRVVVSEAVRHVLLRQVAEMDGLKVDETQISAVIDGLGGEQAAVDLTRSIYDRTTIRDRVRDQLLAIALARKYFNTSVRYDAMVAATREQALAKAKDLASDPERARSIIESEMRGGAPAALDQEQSIADSVDFVLKTPLFSVPAGNVLAYPDPSDTGRGRWFVAVLHERTTASSGQPGAVTVDKVDESRLEGIGVRLLGTHSREIGVRLNPRYGVWSHEYVAIGQTEGEIPAIVVPIARPVTH